MVFKCVLNSKHNLQMVFLKLNEFEHEFKCFLEFWRAVDLDNNSNSGETRLEQNSTSMMAMINVYKLLVPFMIK